MIALPPSKKTVARSARRRTSVDKNHREARGAQREPKHAMTPIATK